LYYCPFYYFLFLGKSTKTVAELLSGSNMHKLFMGWGFAPDPTWRAYSALLSKPPDGSKWGEVRE